MISTLKTMTRLPIQQFTNRFHEVPGLIGVERPVLDYTNIAGSSLTGILFPGAFARTLLSRSADSISYSKQRALRHSHELLDCRHFRYSQGFLIVLTWIVSYPILITVCRKTLGRCCACQLPRSFGQNTCLGPAAGLRWLKLSAVPLTVTYS